MTQLKVAEVFAGIGGVTGGFLDAGGYESLLLNDVDRFARDAFALNFPSLRRRYHVSRVERLTGPEILELGGGEIDGLLGCPPCEGLSPVGRRDEDDERNKLLRQIHRLVSSIRPKFFLLENVPSLLQTALYRHFVESLSGRYMVHGEVLNAAEYGIPQLRRRAVVFGLRKDLGVKPTLPPPTHGGRGVVYDYYTLRYVVPHTARGRHLGGEKTSQRRSIVFSLGSARHDRPERLRSCPAEAKQLSRNQESHRRNWVFS